MGELMKLFWLGRNVTHMGIVMAAIGAAILNATCAQRGTGPLYDWAFACGRLADYMNAYPLKKYSLVGHQCTTFVTGALAAIGPEFDARITIPIAQYQSVLGRRWKFWTDAKYSRLTIALPQQLEIELIEAVANGEFRDVTVEYPDFSSRRSAPGHRPTATDRAVVTALDQGCGEQPIGGLISRPRSAGDLRDSGGVTA